MRMRSRLFLSFAVASSLLAVPDAFAQASAQARHDCLPTSPFPCSTAEDEGLDPFVIEAFMNDVAWWVEQGRLVGGELLVIVNGHIVWHQAVGWSDRDRRTPLERNSIYRLRSMTKPFTGAAILVLAEEGRLDLDDPAAMYLSSFDNERSGTITIRELLTHGAGFEQTRFPDGYWARPDLRSAVDLVGEMGPPNPPGESYRYSDHNSATLGAIVAEVTGAPVEAFIQTRILDPLGLRDTHAHFSPDSAWAPRMNSTYGTSSDGSLERYWDPSMQQQTPWFRASGGLYSTVFDYARWLTVWMNLGAYEEGRLLDEATVREALAPGYSPRYGMHWERSGDPEGNSFLPAFGHSGSDGTFAMAFPAVDAMVFYFTQSRGARGVWQEAMSLIPGLVGLEATAE
ncbi:MAG: beta-lactamase family protein [marine benthic group bacterium]|nr:beta-lactamase family protein [Gemmatimonadota bacterium]